VQSRSRPLTSLSALLGLWIGGRLLTVFWHADPVLNAQPRLNAPLATSFLSKMAQPEQANLPQLSFSEARFRWPELASFLDSGTPHALAPCCPTFVSLPVLHLDLAGPVNSVLQQTEPYTAQTPFLVPVAWRERKQDRFTLSAWSLFRPNSPNKSQSLGGQLGGSQVGMRGTALVAEVAPGIAFFGYGRASRALTQPRSSEAAVGIGLRSKILGGTEVTIERRIGLGRGGRNAWATGVNGGFYDRPVAKRVTVSAYGQAGIVGARQRDVFADLEAMTNYQLGPAIDVGAGFWVSAQPGLTRLDVGPALTVKPKIMKRRFRVSLQWRQRLAGNASPASGPAFVLGSDF
jgi:hypothetical protein